MSFDVFERPETGIKPAVGMVPLKIMVKRGVMTREEAIGRTTCNYFDLCYPNGWSVNDEVTEDRFLAIRKYYEDLYDETEI